MKLAVYTKYGMFESIDQDYTEEYYEQVKELLSKLPEFKYFTFETDEGSVYLTKDMIQDSLFKIVKGDEDDEND